MKSVVICGSKKFKPEIREFSASLRRLGVTVLEPYLYEFKPREWAKMPEAHQKFVSLGLVHDHFQKIRQADVVYIYNKDGYIGNSVTMEMGFAAAEARIIYAFERDDAEVCRDVLIREVVKTPEDLYKKLV